jgi:hypothetical protein
MPDAPSRRAAGRTLSVSSGAGPPGWSAAILSTAPISGAPWRTPGWNCRIFRSRPRGDRRSGSPGARLSPPHSYSSWRCICASFRSSGETRRCWRVLADVTSIMPNGAFYGGAKVPPSTEATIWARRLLADRGGCPVGPPSVYFPKDMPLWNPYQAYGAPLAANMQSQPFSPLYLLFALHPGPRALQFLHLVPLSDRGPVRVPLLAAFSASSSRAGRRDCLHAVGLLYPLFQHA